MNVYTLNGQVLTNDGKWLQKKAVDPYNPLGLPPFTIRVKLTAGAAAPNSEWYPYTTPVAGEADTYDIQYYDIYNPTNTTNWTGWLAYVTTVKEILGANTTGVTNMADLFAYCSSLTSVALFDTTSVTSISRLFQNCTGLTELPDLDITNVNGMTQAFEGCTNVESGILNLYNKAISKPITVTYHNSAFKNCGSNTVTGAAELAQIPSDWK